MPLLSEEETTMAKSISTKKPSKPGLQGPTKLTGVKPKPPKGPPRQPPPEDKPQV